LKEKEKNMPASKPFFRNVATSPDEEIVISGIAGRFPKSANVAEFAENLYNKVSFSKSTLGSRCWCLSQIKDFIEICVIDSS
jgi:hypothetical protein